MLLISSLTSLCFNGCHQIRREFAGHDKKRQNQETNFHAVILNHDIYLYTHQTKSDYESFFCLFVCLFSDHQNIFRISERLSGNSSFLVLTSQNRSLLFEKHTDPLTARERYSGRENQNKTGLCIHSCSCSTVHRNTEEESFSYLPGTMEKRDTTEEDINMEPDTEPEHMEHDSITWHSDTDTADEDDEHLPGAGSSPTISTDSFDGGEEETLTDLSKIGEIHWAPTNSETL